MALACPYGSHRVIEPRGALPQQAWRLDNTPEIADNELLVDVATLNVDAASFRQLQAEAGGDPGRIAAAVSGIVAQRGKLHNPVTGSGGMLLGTVRRIGSALAGRIDLHVGDSIATLVSLSLTPLRLEAVHAVHVGTDQLDVTGTAVLFETGLWAKLPADLPQRLTLAVLDVAGAPAQTARLVKPGDTVLILGGGGKSGLLCSHEARKRAGVTGRVIALDYSEAALERARRLGCADAVLRGDATDALATMRQVEAVGAGRKADVTLVCVNMAGCEMAAILSTRPGGTVYFFSMATSFTAAALGAEGAGADVNMLIGNGYAPGHAEIALQVLRENAVLCQIFTETYGGPIDTRKEGLARAT